MTEVEGVSSDVVAVARCERLEVTSEDLSYESLRSENLLNLRRVPSFQDRDNLALQCIPSSK